MTVKRNIEKCPKFKFIFHNKCYLKKTHSSDPDRYQDATSCSRKTVATTQKNDEKL